MGFQFFVLVVFVKFFTFCKLLENTLKYTFSLLLLRKHLFDTSLILMLLRDIFSKHLQNNAATSHILIVKKPNLLVHLVLVDCSSLWWCSSFLHPIWRRWVLCQGGFSF